MERPDKRKSQRSDTRVADKNCHTQKQEDSRTDSESRKKQSGDSSRSYDQYPETTQTGQTSKKLQGEVREDEVLDSDSGYQEQTARNKKIGDRLN